MVERVRGVAPGAAIAVSRHAWAGFEGGEPTGRVLAVCAIGNPGPFLRAVRERADVAGEMVLRDHDPFAPATVERIRREAAGVDAIVTTAKDWAKLSRAGDLGRPVIRPILEMTFDRGWEELRALVLGAAEQGANTA
jgi:tetraacyldisaccharide-1-P 4'-kinase